MESLYICRNTFSLELQKEVERLANQLGLRVVEIECFDEWDTRYYLELLFDTLFNRLSKFHKVLDMINRELDLLELNAAFDSSDTDEGQPEPEPLLPDFVAG